MSQNEMNDIIEPNEQWLKETREHFESGRFVRLYFGNLEYADYSNNDNHNQ